MSYINKLIDNYTQIPNELITDTSLSHGAVRVFLFLASKPSGWDFYSKNIKKNLNISNDHTIAKYLKELRENGWLLRSRNNKTKGYDYTLMDKPVKPHIEEESTETEKDTQKKELNKNITSGYKLSNLAYRLNDYKFRFPIDPTNQDYFPILAIKSNFNFDNDIEQKFETSISLNNVPIVNKKLISKIWKYLYIHKKDEIFDYFVNNYKSEQMGDDT